MSVKKLEPKTDLEIEAEKHGLPPGPDLNLDGRSTRPMRFPMSPWPDGFLAIFVDDDGRWNPLGPVEWSNECHQCGGQSTVSAEPARFCPWCGHRMDILSACASDENEHTSLHEWTARYREIIREDFPHLVTDTSHSDEA